MAIVDNKTYGLTGAQVKDLAARVNNLKTNAGAPTTATVGTVGQLLADTTNGKLYICTAIVPGTDPDPDTYTWEEVGTGGAITVAYIKLADFESQYHQFQIYKDVSLVDVYTYDEIVALYYAGPLVFRIVDPATYSTVADLEQYARDSLVVGKYWDSDPYSFCFEVYYDSSLATSSAARLTKFDIFCEDRFSGDPDEGTHFGFFMDLIEKDVPSIVQTIGTSQTAVMSQDAASKLVYANPGSSYQKTIKIGKSASATESDASVAIGQEATASGSWAVAIGYRPTASAYSIAAGVQASASGQYAEALGRQASAGSNGSVALGAYSSASSVGEMNIGSLVTSYGYNSSNYRLISGVYDGQSAHDAATKGQLDGRIKTNAGAPTTSTAGTVGQLLEDTTNGDLYICTDATNPYVWEEVGTGGGANTMILYTNQNLPDTASSSYHLYSDINLTTTVNTRDVYDCYKSGGNVVLFIPISSDNPGQIYGGYITNLHQVYFDTSDDVYVALFVVKEDSANPKLYKYSGSTGNWQGKEAFVDAVSPSALNGIITTNAGAPTTSTAGTKGQLLEDTTNGKLYICTAASGGTYTWEEIDYSGLTTLSYGNSTWNDFLTAYNAGKIVYCRASSAADPSSGSQGRMAFMAYINNPTTPTEVEFQYVRSVSSKTAAQPCDQVFVYKLTSAGGGTWTVATRDMTYKIAAGTNVTTSYSSGTVTINAVAPVITMQSTDPGEGVALAANNFIAVYSV